MKTLRTPRLLLLLALTAAVGCSGDEDPPAAAACETSAECTTVGELCLDGACVACETSAACEADAVYMSELRTQCREGVCTTCEPGLVGCGCVEDACTTGECVADVCTDCTRGEPGCVCLDNNACNAGALCSDGLCETCTLGAELCGCDAGACDAGLVCTGDVCVADPCPAGTADCSCDGGACAGDLYCDASNLCRTCSSDIAGCPCDGDACGGDNYCDASLCVACPETDKPIACGCNASDQCATDLVCDADDFVCRAPLACGDLTCLPNQLCDAPTDADAFCVPNACVDGYFWDGSACSPLPTAACTDASGAPSAEALACSSQSQVCVDGSAGPVCVDTCASLGCGINRRDCTAGATIVDDAVCGACEPGYVENQGVCALDPAATCTAGVPGSIEAACASRFRVCEEHTNGASCGACTDGRAVDPRTGQCVEVEACGDGQCFDGEFCHYPQDGRAPECRLRCPSGMAMTEAGACIACGAVSCGGGEIHGALVEGQCVCEDQTFCAYNSDSGARCRANPCGPQEAVSTLGGACTSCNVTCGNDDGETDRVWPWRDQFGGCFCETQDDYYQPYGGGATAMACDQDGDGWINVTAQNAFLSASTGVNNVPDEATLANFRCARRTIDRIRLVNEFGQRRDIGLCGTDGVVLDWAPGQAPAACLNGPNVVTLAESDTLESDNLLSSDDVQFPNLGARKLKAVELNALTKACASVEADFNLNGTTDLLEQQPLNRTQLPGSTDAELLFRAAAFFVETHAGYYQAPGAGAGPGVYVVEERSRCGDDFPLGYQVNEGYWRGCERRRNPSFDGLTPTASRVTMDFAQFGCADGTGSCDVAPPLTTGTSTDGDNVVDHDVCALRAAGQYPIADVPWRGMNHHNQFVCAQIGAGTAHYRVPTSELSSPANADPAFDFNSCAAVTCAGEAGCEESFARDGEPTQPEVPNLDCSYTAGTAIPADAVGFVSARFAQLTEQEPYVRGCINEAVEFSDLCPGYTANPEAVLTSANRGDSGKLVCACGLEYAGPNCEFACPQRAGTDGKLHFGGPERTDLTLAEQQQFGCIIGPGQSEGGFCTQHAPDASIGFTGGPRGYWLCGEPTVTHPADPAQPFLEGTLSSGGQVFMSGMVKASPVRRSLLASTATSACTNGTCFVDGDGNARHVTAY
ncbi:MAG: hypothetical protein RIT81_14430 [Deltaproteobacteria bacterium]